jgi:hypothetical protein
MCADQRHLAVVAAADPSKVYSLTVPVSGMKALREYFKDLGNYGIGPEEVITELGFDDAASYPKITFKQKGYVPEKAISRVDTLIASDSVKVATRQLAPQAAGPAIAAPTASKVLRLLLHRHHKSMMHMKTKRCLIVFHSVPQRPNQSLLL